jgi:nucleoside-diphosphate-sugar epimerase
MATNVLLIGGTRFLGLAIAAPFIEKGYDVYEMNRGTRPPAKGVNEQIICDKADRKAFAKVLTKHRWDIIIDTILTDEDLEFVIDTIGNNVGHFIHTGSLGVYGDARQFPVTESFPIAEYEGDKIVFNYKIKQDQVITRAFQEKAFPGTILRMSYIYGPGDKLLDGWGGRSEEFFQLLRNNKKILLPNDGCALLHPGHVTDLGRAFLHAAERPETSIGQIYNIAGSHAVMMSDYINIIVDAMQVKPDIEYASINDVCKHYPGITNERGMTFACQHMCASITKAKQDLNWYPTIPLAAGIRDNINWMKQQKMI